MWLGQIRRVIIAQHKIDFRKRFDGLLSESYKIGANPYDGDCVVFFNRDSTQLRFLAGDDLGLFLGCRRFEGGKFSRGFNFTNDPECKQITIAELSLLLEGVSFTVQKRAKKWK
jgi:hypothetical protein